MNKLNTLLVLAMSVVNLTVNAVIVDGSTIKYSIGKHCSVEFSIQNADDDGNILHKLIKNKDNENTEFVLQLRVKPGALKKDITERVQQFPYNLLPEPMNYRLLKDDMLEDELEEIITECCVDLKALLSGKDANDKMPIDLLKEAHDSNAIELANEVEPVVQECEEYLKEKSARLDARYKNRAERNAGLILMAARFLKQ